MSAQQLHDFIRGNDKVPGAWTEHNGEVSENPLGSCACFLIVYIESQSNANERVCQISVVMCRGLWFVC